MRNIKIIIEYDGTDFKGWQVQGKGERTIQNEIKKAIKKTTSETVTVIGSGRTDSGVHAQGQTANFKIKSKLPVKQIQSALNAHLPRDVRILTATETHEDFHSQYDAITKTYRYTIYTREIAPTYQARSCLHFPHMLNMTKLKREADSLIGRQDFKAFQAADPSKKEKINTTREITDVLIKKKGDIITIDITANGFLYKMVRHIIGTLLEVSTGKLPENTIKEMIATKKRSIGGKTLPAHGLCLISVYYS